MLPQDPMILLSWVNTKLRDEYASLEELCRDQDVEQSTLEETLQTVGYRYVPEQNRFV